jgi:hypothetical protein
MSKKSGGQDCLSLRLEKQKHTAIVGRSEIVANEQLFVEYKERGDN